MTSDARDDYDRFAIDRRAAFEHLKASVRTAAPRNERGSIVYTTPRRHGPHRVGVFSIDQRSLEPVDLTAAIAATEGWAFGLVDGRPALTAPADPDEDAEAVAIAALREILNDHEFRHVRI